MARTNAHSSDIESAADITARHLSPCRVTEIPPAFAAPARGENSATEQVRDLETVNYLPTGHAVDNHVSRVSQGSEQRRAGSTPAPGRWRHDTAQPDSAATTTLRHRPEHPAGGCGHGFGSSPTEGGPGADG